MDRSLIEALLNNCSAEVTSDTIGGTWKATQRTSLQNASSTDTRSNTPWKKAEFVVAYKKEGEPSFDLNGALQGWQNITDGFRNQYLILEEENDKWGVYDSSVKKVAGENEVESFLTQQVMARLLDKTAQRKSEFRAWLFQQQGEGDGTSMSPMSVLSYINAVDQIPEEFGQMGSLWECATALDLEKYLNKLYAENGWTLFNESLNDKAAEKCLEKYKQFLKERAAGLVVKNAALASEPLQQIRYGAPGTGKSAGIVAKVPDEDVFRTTFHPDSDYSTFIGAYKPTMKGAEIAYAFRPQAFMRAYVRAWQLMKSPLADGTVNPVVLVIEEINRGNCAQVFGDLFQLLDRDDATGFSTYPIDADTDLAKWLAEVRVKKPDGLDGDLIFGAALADVKRPSCIKEDDWDKIVKGEKLALPSNLYIWATMNTSDQSLFPIDSAFKRRWDWKYVPIAKPDKDGDATWKERKIKVGESLYDWWDFLTIINRHIAKATESEDKQLGYFFVKAPDDTGYITAERFANKVLFYLYGDVFKSYDLPTAVFKNDAGKAWSFKDFFYDKKTEVDVAGGVKVTKNAGDVNETVLTAFLDHLKWKDDEGEKTVNKTAIGA